MITTDGLCVRSELKESTHGGAGGERDKRTELLDTRGLNGYFFIFQTLLIIVYAPHRISYLYKFDPSRKGYQMCRNVFREEKFPETFLKINSLNDLLLVVVISYLLQ